MSIDADDKLNYKIVFYLILLMFINEPNFKLMSFPMSWHQRGKVVSEFICMFQAILTMGKLICAALLS